MDTWKKIFIVVILFFLIVGYYNNREKNKIITLYKKKSELNNLLDNLEKYNSLRNKDSGEFTCKIPYPVYYINMDKDKDRRDFMEKQAKNIGKTFTRIPGFNGYGIKNTETDTVNDITFYNGYDDLTKGEIGCTLSHLIAINTAYNNGDEIALICEDDLLFDTCLVNGITMEEIANNCPNNWGIIQLVSLIHITEYKKFKSYNYTYIKRDDKNIFWGTAGYLINKKGMEEVLNIVIKKNRPNTYFIEPISLNFPKQGTADGYILDIATTYTIFPSPFISDNNMGSTIHQDHVPNHIKSSIKALGHFPIIHEKQLECLKVLLDINKILEESKQDFFLTHNTLLYLENKKSFSKGALDIGILNDNYIPNSLNKILESNNFALSSTSSTSSVTKKTVLSDLSFIHKNTQTIVNFFIFYTSHDKEYIYTTNEDDTVITTYTPFKLTQKKFFGFTFNVPSDINLFLQEKNKNYDDPNIKINIICFLTVRPSNEFYEFCKKLKNVYDGDMYICIDDNTYEIPEYNNSDDISIIKVDNEECKNAGFRNLVSYAIGLEVSSKDKALYYFCKKYQDKDINNIWFIEEDVFIPTLNTIPNIDEKYPTGDFLCKEKLPIEKWTFENYTIEQLSKFKIDPPYFHTMVCAIRISNKYLKYIEDFADKYKNLFLDEVFFIILALKNNLDIVLVDEFKGIEWRHVWKLEDINKNYLYHPIKDMKTQVEFHKELL
jgi:GR25 family glycosyltransferase involved in LPS biosynthesis